MVRKEYMWLRRIAMKDQYAVRVRALCSIRPHENDYQSGQVRGFGGPTANPQGSRGA